MSLLLIPQRYEFSSKSQRICRVIEKRHSCCWYHKGTNFQANHNTSKYNVLLFSLLLIPQRYEFSSKSQRNFVTDIQLDGCCWYHKGTNFQANHNGRRPYSLYAPVVADTTKVRIFKQITTPSFEGNFLYKLLLIPQRYEFSSKSQRILIRMTFFLVVADTTKVRIFKQITTGLFLCNRHR